MWVYKLGIEQAKRMLLTGDVIDGKQAKEYGLVSSCVPLAKLDEEVEKLADRFERNTGLVVTFIEWQVYQRINS
jgi:enoyl-CoA hydratase/carnithine racemase